MSVIAALYVETEGCYFDLPGVDPWDEARDARKYAGPHPVVAHPPCQRWGRFWHGSTRKPHQFKLGDDAGCFASALAAVRTWGGVLEHPADSRAWSRFNLNAPRRGEGWTVADMEGGWTCYVEQGHYGHHGRKPTWLYAHGVELPELDWSQGEQRIPDWMSERYGYEKSAPHRCRRNGGRQGQDPHPQRDAAAVPRRAAEHRAHGQAKEAGSMIPRLTRNQEVV